MSKEISDLMHQHKNQLESELPFFWLFEIEVPTDPPTRYRLTNYTRRVNFGTNSLGEALSYYPFPIVHGGIEESSTGDLPSISITIANFSREISQALADYDGLVGQPVVIRLVSAAELTNAQAQIREDAEILSGVAKGGVVVFTLSSGNLYERKLPPFRVSSVGCRHLYGGIGCGYNLSLGTLPTCSKLFEGENGCGEHGDDEVATGQTRKHPRRFGGFPGVRGVLK